MAPVRLLGEASSHSSFLDSAKKNRIRKEFEKGRRSEMGTGTMASSWAEALSVWGSGVELA